MKWFAVVFTLFLLGLGSMVLAADVEIQLLVQIAEFDVTEQAQIMVTGAGMTIVLPPGEEKRISLEPGMYQVYAMMLDPTYASIPALEPLVVKPGQSPILRLQLQPLPGFSPPQLEPASVWDWPISSQVIDWDPKEEAERLAKLLLEASSVPQVVELLYDVFSRLGIGVYDGYGQVLLAGNEASLDDFYLYDVQLQIIARNFVAQRYVPLENIAHFWGEFGLLALDDSGQHRTLDGVIVEAGLRSMRRWAEELPQEPNGFLIRLVDALADREHYPFDLLIEPEEEEDGEDLDFAGLVEQEMRQELQDEAEMMRSEGLIEADDWMLTDEGTDMAMGALLGGDLRGLIGMFLGEDEDIDDIFAMAREGLQEAMADEDMDLESLQPSLQALTLAEQVLDGEGVFGQDLAMELARNALDTVTAARNSMLDRIGTVMDSMQAEIDAIGQRVNPDDAEQAMNAAFAVSTLRGELLDLSGQLQLLEQQVEAAEWNYLRQLEEDEEEEDRPPLGGDPPAEALSSIFLDPLQALLVQIDFLFHPRTEDLAAVRAQGDRNWLPWARIAYASRVTGPDLFGQARRGMDIIFGRIVQQFLDDFAPRAGKMLSRLNVAEAVVDVLHGMVVMSAYTVDLQIHYHPADASLDQGIRMLGVGEGRWDKWIELEIAICFDPPEAIRAIEAGRMAAARFLGNTMFSVPITPGEVLSHSIARQLANFELPEIGPQADILVRVEHPNDLYRLTRRLEEEWHDFGQWLLKTDEHGIARARLFPREDSQISMTWGGFPAAAHTDRGGQIRVHPMTQVPENIFLSVAEGILGLADHLQGAFPGLGAADGQLYIEKLEPTFWTGNVRLTRRIEANYDGQGRAASVELDNRFSRAVETTWMTEWEVHLFSEVTLGREGGLISHGPAPLQAHLPSLRVKGSESGVINREAYGSCGGEDRKFVELESYLVESELELSKDDSLRVFIEQHHWLDTYRVVILPVIPSEGFLQTGFKYFTEDVCSHGQVRSINHPPEAIRVPPRPEIARYLAFGPDQFPVLSDTSHWDDFVRDAEILTGSTDWVEQPRGSYAIAGRPVDFGFYRPNIVVYTEISWFLRRVKP